MLDISTRAEEDRIINNYDKSVFFYGSRNCGHCKQIQPFVETLERSFPNIKFVHIEVTGRKVDGLRGAPTFVLYYNHQAINVIEGANRKQLDTAVNSLANM